jgi:hypothetical protein
MTKIRPESPPIVEVADAGERALAAADALDVLAVRECDARDVRWTARLSAALAWVVAGLWRHTSAGALLVGAALVLTVVGLAVEVWGARRIRAIVSERSTLRPDRG